MERRDKRRLEAKIKEWDISMRGFDLFVKHFKREYNNMIDFILFYKKPKNKLDKTLHVIEVACFYIILQYAWIGLFGTR